MANRKGSAAILIQILFPICTGIQCFSHREVKRIFLAKRGSRRKSLKAAAKFESKLKLGRGKKVSYDIASPVSSHPSLSYPSNSLYSQCRRCPEGSFFSAVKQKKKVAHTLQYHQHLPPLCMCLCICSKAQLQLCGQAVPITAHPAPISSGKLISLK